MKNLLLIAGILILSQIPCQAAILSSGATGITGVTAGTNVTGGGTSGTVTVTLADPLSNSSGTITTLQATTITVNTGLLLRGSGGTIGQVFLSSGSTAAPIWSYQGLVVQAVQVTVTASSATTLGAFVPTNLSGSITPNSASNRIKLTTSCEVSQTVGAGTAAFTFTRGATNLGATNGFTNFQSNVTGTSDRAPIAFSYIDSPATTSATTYKVAMQTSAGTVTFDDNSATCVLLMEEIGPS